jgi:hypothetical protein
MESMRVNKTTGKCTINHLKGSWNLALQAEGWAQADAAIRADLAAAITNNAFLKSGYDILKQKPELWQERSLPVASTLWQIKTLSNSLFALSWEGSADRLYKSSDLGANWQPVSTSLDTGRFSGPIDVDQDKLYIPARNGIIVSSDQGATFNWSFHWTWDACAMVDMQNGYGWAAIVNWGSLSGPIRKTPTDSWTLRRGDIPWSAMSASYAFADPVDPLNIAYIRNAGGNYRTLDSGLHWTPFTYCTIIYTTSIDGKSLIYRDNAYSEDHGDTWKPLGLTARQIIRDEATGIFFVAAASGGIYAGQPGDWHAYGLSGQVVQSLSICSGKLFAVTTAGKIFSTKDDIAKIASLY